MAHYTVKRKALAVLLVMSLAIPAMIALCDTEDSAGDSIEYAGPYDISVSASLSDISLKAGDSVKVYLDIRNTFTRELVVYVYYNGSDPDLDVSFPNGHRIEVDAGKIQPCEIDITVWKYARSTDHTISFDIRINDPERGNTIEAAASDMFVISVTSDLSAGKSYNKIMGVVDNNLPAPFNGSWFSAIVSLAIWILIAGAVAYIAVPLVQQAIVDAKKEEKKIEERLER